MFGYDPSGRLVSKTYQDSSGSLFASWIRNYSAHGQVARETGPGSSGNRSVANAYDGFGRLSQVQDVGGACEVRQYAYNADSFRTGKTTWDGTVGAACPATTETSSSAWSATPNSFDQILNSLKTGTGAGSGTYSYDLFGRVTNLPAVDSSSADRTNPVTLNYFANDMPASQVQGTTSRTYGLDAFGRLGKWTDTVGSTTSTTTSHFDGSSDVPSWLDFGSSWSRQLAGPDGMLDVIAGGSSGSSNGTAATVQIVSPHGDVFATIPDSPAVSATAISPATDLDEFGNVLAGSPGALAWVGGQSRQLDIASSLIQMGVRLYNPATGGFLSVDPIDGGNATPYSYPTDPVASFDTSGEFHDNPWVGGWCNKSCQKKLKNLAKAERRLAAKAQRAAERKHFAEELEWWGGLLSKISTGLGILSFFCPELSPLAWLASALASGLFAAAGVISGNPDDAKWTWGQVASLVTSMLFARIPGLGGLLRNFLSNERVVGFLASAFHGRC